MGHRVYSFRSERELQEYTKNIIREKVVLLWGENRVFIFLPPHLGQVKSGQIDLFYTTRQGLSESASYDLTWPSVRKKNGGQKKFFFFHFFDILRV